MSNEISKNNSSPPKPITRKVVTAIPIEYVARITWTVELGRKIKTLRGKTSRREFTANMKAAGYEISHQYLQYLEDGKVDALPLTTLIGMCKALGVELGQILPVVEIAQTKEFGDLFY